MNTQTPDHGFDRNSLDHSHVSSYSMTNFHSMRDGLRLAAAKNLLKNVSNPPIPATCVLALLLLLATGCKRTTPVEEISASKDRSSNLEEYVPADTDWPWWRGPGRNGNAVTNGTAYPTEWSDSTNVIWKAEIPGRGHSSPTIVGDRIYIASADEKEQVQAVMALNRNTGDSIWRTSIHKGGFPGRGQLHSKSTHANCTVACDGERLFVGFLNHDAIYASALTLQGEIIWQEKLGAFDSKFGYAPSPVVYKSLVIYAADNQGGGYLCALDRETGEIIWRKARPAVSTYSSPVVATVGGRDQLLMSGCDVVAGFDPLTGEQLWSVPGTTEATCGTMVWNENCVFASGGYPDKQTICVNVADTPREVWTNRQKSYEQSMLADEQHVYAVTDDGIFFCWDALSGEEKWKKRLGGQVSASLVRAGEFIYCTNERGLTFVIRPGESSGEVVAKNQLGTESFATITPANGELFLRVATGSGAGRQEFLYRIGQSETTSPNENADL